MKPQLDELTFMQELRNSDVEVTLKPWWILLDFPTKFESVKFQKRSNKILEKWASRYRIIVGVKGDNSLKPRPVNRTRGKNKMTQQPLILDPNSGLQLGRMKLGRQLLSEITFYLENPNVAGGFVHLATEHQCMLSLACANFMPSANATVADAVTWKRDDYWLSDDLARFRAESVLWTPNDGEWHEFKYCTFDPLLGSESENGWTRYHNRFKYLVDDFGTAYHVGQNLESNPVDKPV